MKIGVVVPAFNEERFIGATLDTMPSWVDFIVVVDDGSKDKTAEYVRQYADHDHRVQLVSLSPQRGPGAAIIEGYATIHDDTTCDIAVVMAGDNQMDPGDLPGILDPICEGRAVFVKGTRFRHERLFRVMPITRYLGNRVLSWFTRSLSGYSELEDAQCGYTALSSDLLTEVIRDGLVSGYGLPNAMLVFLGKMGAEIEQAPVRPVYRDEKSGLNLLTVLRVYPALLWRIWLAKKKQGPITNLKHDNALPN